MMVSETTSVTVPGRPAVLDAEHEQTPQPGTIVGGRFRVVRELGRGGMGVVLEAIDLWGSTGTDRRVALKLVRMPTPRYQKRMSARLRREAEILTTIAHANIVRLLVHGVGLDGVLFLALELIAGETLRERLGRSGRLRTTELADIVVQICAGLDAAHACGVIHRDLKPANVFLADTPSGVPCVKLVDFGIALSASEPRLTKGGEVLGTPRYMSPEQLAGDSDVDQRTDVYSVGVLLYEALTGCRYEPLCVGALISAIARGNAPAPSIDRGDVSSEVAAVVDRAMAIHREERFATAGELAGAFVRAVSS